MTLPINEYNLATPPYTEGVQCMFPFLYTFRYLKFLYLLLFKGLVSKTTHFIHPQQLHELKACWNYENNARPVQESNGRIVKLRSKSSLQVIN